MLIRIMTTERGPTYLKNIAKIDSHGTSTNSTPPPATVTLTTAEPFNWLKTSTGFTVHYPRQVRAAVIGVAGRVERYI